MPFYDKSYHLPHSNNNIKGRLKTLIEDFQTTFVFTNCLFGY
ncbi:hypothetical protein NEISICOT_02911 [Neisseria sicca ATCC 29256]|uniref:Uncharacterized protein n=1 Tax=Neisseria sicca ATCC 29256 TaxID=547045 RepID=C6M8N8_NEISI|nr:hypothetical protein NEISICOT_02911 [Neisseria sicca ATCC 29256]